MSGLGESSGSPRWSVVTPGDGDARADGGAAGEQGHGLGRPAVVAQRGQAQAVRLVKTMLPSTPLTSPPEPPVPTRLLLPETLTGPPMSLAPEGLVLPATMVSVRVAVPW